MPIVTKSGTFKDVGEWNDAVRSTFEDLKIVNPDLPAHQDILEYRSVNDTGGTAWQRICHFQNSCGVCIAAHGKVFIRPQSRYHFNCRCDDMPLTEGAEGYGFPPLEEYWGKLAPDMQVNAVGKYNFQLVKGGTLDITDLMDNRRVKTFFEVSKFLKPEAIESALDAKGLKYWRGLQERIVEPFREALKAKVAVLVKKPEMAELLKDLLVKHGASPQLIRAVLNLEVSSAIIVRAVKSGSIDAVISKKASEQKKRDEIERIIEKRNKEGA